MFQQDLNPAISWNHGPKPFSLCKEGGEWHIYVLTTTADRCFQKVIYATYNNGTIALLALDRLLRRRGF